MPQFGLNDAYAPSFRSLSDFEKQYLEAMFFTNGDIGGDDESKLNRLGVKRLTRDSIKLIQNDCAKFLAIHIDGKTVAQWINEKATGKSIAGHDFWFTRQGHGTGFSDGGWIDEKYDGPLTRASELLGECDVETRRGWIYVRQCLTGICFCVSVNYQQKERN